MAKTFNSIFSALGGVYGFPVNNSKSNENVSSGDDLNDKDELYLSDGKDDISNYFVQNGDYYFRDRFGEVRNVSVYFFRKHVVCKDDQFSKEVDNADVPFKVNRTSSRGDTEDDITEAEDETVRQIQDELITAAVKEGEHDEGTLEPPKKKYKRFKTPETRVKRDKEKHPILEPCIWNHGCKKWCSETFRYEDRIEMHEKFWELNYNERADWICGYVQNTPPPPPPPPHSERPRKLSLGMRNKDATRIYQLPSRKGEHIAVCQKCFLATLGFTQDSCITTALKKKNDNFIKPTPDQRGCQTPSNKLPDDVMKAIRAHIRPHNPSISHHRREHAPNRLYISPQYTVKGMSDDFNVQHEAWRRRMRNLRRSGKAFDCGTYG